MADLIFNNVSKVFPGDVVAVESFSLTVQSPQMVVLVGPSGCGKTTLLRMIAGLETPTTGEIHLGEKRLDTLEPRKRDIAMVFQSYALYPHMSVRQNLSFGLRLRKIPRATIEQKVAEVADTLEMTELLDRKPGELSGGQRQRVALGRAIIREPRVFLFDEPLSNLDARLRSDMRATIKLLYQRLKVTSIYVTHDQVEAMTIGEQLVVMSEGRIRQVGEPEACYREPADTFVASFLGSPAMNLMDARWDLQGGRLIVDGNTQVTGADVLSRLSGYREDHVVVGVRPEHIRSSPAGSSVELRGRLTLREPLGHETLSHIRLGSNELVARGSDEFISDHEGQVSLYIEARHLHLFSADDGTRVGGSGSPRQAGPA